MRRQPAQQQELETLIVNLLKLIPFSVFCDVVIDERHGLENTDEIRKLMKKYKCNFDQARLIQQQNKMKANGIDPRTGVPIDPKAVYFS